MRGHGGILTGADVQAFYGAARFLYQAYEERTDAYRCLVPR